MHADSAVRQSGKAGIE